MYNWLGDLRISSIEISSIYSLLLKVILLLLILKVLNILPRTSSFLLTIYPIWYLVKLVDGLLVILIFIPLSEIVLVFTLKSLKPSDDNVTTLSSCKYEWVGDSFWIDWIIGISGVIWNHLV